MLDQIDRYEIVLRILFALVAGLIIGFDSWRHQRNAGIRNLLCRGCDIDDDDDVNEQCFIESPRCI
jgi:hypothetical protein